MYNLVLEENLKFKRLYNYIDGGLEIHLGVADKSNLLKELNQRDYIKFEDLWRCTMDHLWEMGYRSKSFERRKKSEMKRQTASKAMLKVHLSTS